MFVLNKFTHPKQSLLLQYLNLNLESKSKSLILLYFTQTTVWLSQIMRQKLSIDRLIKKFLNKKVILIKFHQLLLPQQQSLVPFLSKQYHLLLCHTQGCLIMSLKCCYVNSLKQSRNMCHNQVSLIKQ